MFQSYALFPHMTVLENVAFGLRRRRIAERAGAAPTRRCGSSSSTTSPQRQPAQLSGGQQQRVALARAVVNRPALLLLDEPLGALDLKLRRQMQIELKDIQNEVGLTFLHVTHDQEEAMTMADTVAVMNKGEIEQMGAPEELYELPQHRVRRELPRPVEPVHRAGRVVERRHSIVVDVAGTTIEVPARARPAARRRGHDRRATREAHAAHERARRRAAGINVLGPGRVTDVSFSGVSTQYQVGVPGLGIVTVFAQNMVFGPVVNDGAEVWLSWTVEHGFGLADEPGPAHRGSTPTTDTHAIAMQQREQLEAELEEA